MMHKKILPKKKYKNNRHMGSKVRKTKAKVDTFNISSPDIFAKFFYEPERYIIDRVDIKSRADQFRWYKLFGKSFINKTKKGYVCPYVELYIVYCIDTDIYLPLKVPASNKKSYTIEFGGLQRYDKKSEKMQAVLWDLLPDLQYCRINRIDVAIDIRNRIPHKVYESLKRVRRYPKRYKNSTYFKTRKEKKRNGTVNIILYDKGLKEGLGLEGKYLRLECRFSLKFFNALRVVDMEKAIAKIEARIRRDTGLHICICEDYILS